MGYEADHIAGPAIKESAGRYERFNQLLRHPGEHQVSLDG